jgi:1-acyl-sn-glycerol-3-phosphate acyltransferase
MVRFFYIYKKNLIYILKQFLRAALWLFCSDINIKNKHLLNNKKPLLIIANHPNSFLDAIIIGVQYNRPINFLARGDVFTKRHHRFLLRLLNMIPVYRLREGKQNLHLNEYAFKETVRLIQKGEAVLIFIEGNCTNIHTLHPFKKGTARIVEKLNEQNIYHEIHIVGIAYNHFRGIGKKVNLCISEFSFLKPVNGAKDKIDFNKAVFDVLSKNIFPPGQKTIIHKTPLYYFHYLYYQLIHKIVDKKTRGSVFYDSVLFSLLFFTYPLLLFVLYCILSLLYIPLTIIFGILLCIPILSKYSIETA